MNFKAFLFGFVEKKIVLHTDDVIYPHKAVALILNKCLVDDIDIVKIKHVYRFPEMKRELTSVDVTLRVSRKNEYKIKSLVNCLLANNVHMDVKEN